MNSVKLKSMQLDDDQYKKIEDLAGCNYSPEKIALYLSVSEDEFLKEFNDPESQVRFHYDRGILIAQAEVDLKNLEEAKKGNLTAGQQWRKEAFFRKIENFKRKLQYEDEKRALAQLQEFVSKGESKTMDIAMATYYEQLDFIRCLYNKYNSKTFIINSLQTKWPELSFKKAGDLFVDSLNFFYLDNEVKEQAWANIYADRMDNMAFICIEMNEYEIARRLFMDAAKLRGVGKEKPHDVPPELLDRRPIIYTIRPQDVGITPQPRRLVAKLIDDLDIDERQKELLKRDAQVQDVEFEIFPSDEQDQAIPPRG